MKQAIPMSARVLLARMSLRSVCAVLFQGAVFITVAPGTVSAVYRDDIGYNRLLNEQGVITPDGSGVLVTQVEAGGGGDLAVYMPDPAVAQFTGKTINDRTGLFAGTYSGHATSVGTRFYGSTSSMASAINTIDVYSANYWLQPDYLRFGTSFKPLVSTSRVANHSWVAGATDPADDSGLLRRTDWVIDTDEYLQVVGTRNNTGTNLNLLSGAFNVIAVGRTDGLHGTGTNTIDADYTAGRTRPELVAPLTVTSASTPVVAAAAALLVETGHMNPGLSTDPAEVSTSNRNGDAIYNAERSETIKAVLMAGADRYTSNLTTADITDYRQAPANQAANGLDARFGAGQVNIYNSYHIIAAGEQNSDEDDAGGTGTIGGYGFDYDPAFGGAGGTNSTASYYFSTGNSTPVLKATLAWNIDISGGGGMMFNGSATLHDLDLYLYDVTGSPFQVAASAGTLDNTESLWQPLSPDRDYLLQVVPKNSFNRDYALAWHMEADSDADTIVDVHDNCPQAANSNQLDTDADGDGDACDADDDNDWVPDNLDAFPLDPNEDTDTDNDGMGNNADDDDDNDGLTDADESGYGTDPLLFDSDGDGFGDGDEVALGYNPSSPASTPEWGDLNGDGTVNAADVLIASRAVLETLELTAEQEIVAIIAPLVDGEPQPVAGRSIGVQDLLLIQRKATGDAVF